MTYREWIAYWKNLDWTRKWFVIFLLIRPLVDTLYFIKEYSSLLSPVYIVGVLTPILAFASFQSRKFRKAPHRGTDELMRTWGLIIFINGVFLLSWAATLNNFGDIIKYISPPVIFFYMRRFVKNKEDLRFVLTTFLVSCIVPFFTLAFEIFVHPLTPEYVSEGRGGGARLRGNFADSVSYALYFIGAFIVMSYFFLDKVFSAKKEKSPLFRLLVIFFICVVGIASLRHVATWAVFLVSIALLMWFNAKNIRGFAVVIVIGLIVLPVFAEPIYNQFISPLLQKEINVIEGDSDIQYGLNGRISRWERYFQIWGEMDVVSKFLGVSFSHVKEAPIMMSGGMHSDYVRILFLSGIIGVSVYVIFLFSLLFRIRHLKAPERFLFLACYLSLTMYSISTLPMIYLPFLNYVFPVFCFALMPARIAYAPPQPVAVVPNSKKGRFRPPPPPVSVPAAT